MVKARPIASFLPPTAAALVAAPAATLHTSSLAGDCCVRGVVSLAAPFAVFAKARAAATFASTGHHRKAVSAAPSALSTSSLAGDRCAREVVSLAATFASFCEASTAAAATHRLTGRCGRPKVVAAIGAVFFSYALSGNHSHLATLDSTFALTCRSNKAVAAAPTAALPTSSPAGDCCV